MFHWPKNCWLLGYVGYITNWGWGDREKILSDFYYTKQWPLGKILSDSITQSSDTWEKILVIGGKSCLDSITKSSDPWEKFCLDYITQISDPWKKYFSDRVKILSGFCYTNQWPLEKSSLGSVPKNSETWEKYFSDRGKSCLDSISQSSWPLGKFLSGLYDTKQWRLG